MSDNHSQGGGKYQHEQELSNILMFLFGGFFAYLLLIIIIKYLAFISPYFYYPFAMPVFAFAKNGLMAGLIVGLYALICVGFAFHAKKRKGKFSWSAIVYAVFFIFVAAGEMLFFKKNTLGQVSTPLTKHVTEICNPESNGMLYILTCQNSVDDIGQLPISYIILIVLLPNLIYGIHSLILVGRNFLNLSKHPKTKAKQRVPDVDSLINLVAPIQPHLQLYRNIDPNKIDYNSGQLRLMDSPRRYCFENDLVSNFVKRPTKRNASSFKDNTGTEHQTNKHKFTFEDADNIDYVPNLDVDKFEQAMIADLGDIFTSVDDLTACETIVLGLCLSLTCRADLHMKEDEAKSILKEVEAACDDIFIWVAKDIHTKHKVNMGMQRYPKLQEFRDMIKRWDNHPIAQEIYANHAYVNTIILRCLTDAKKLGVFQPSSLRWLMFYDRKLYAVVQNESRPSVFAENAATSSHFYFELKAGKKIPRPMIQIAFDGFMDNLREYRYQKKHVMAWKHYKETGDASKMIEYKMVSEHFKFGK